MLLMLSAEHWILIAVVILLLFGGRKIPELMRGLGSGIKEFKDATKEEKQEKTSHATADKVESEIN